MARGWSVRKLTMFETAEIGHRGRRALLFRGASDRTGAASALLTYHRMACIAYLTRLGIPCAITILTNRVAPLVELFERHGPLSVRPSRPLGGRGISRRVSTPEALETAFQVAMEASGRPNEPVVGQVEGPGDTVRITVVGGRLFACHLPEDPQDESRVPVSLSRRQETLARGAFRRIGIDPVGLDVQDNRVISATVHPELHWHGDEALDAFLDHLFEPKPEKQRFAVRPGKARDWEASDPDLALYAASQVEQQRARGGRAWKIPGASNDWALLATRRSVEPLRSTLTDLCGLASFNLCRSKAATHEVLYQRGYPVPQSVNCVKPEQAYPLLDAVGKVVVKPVDGSGGDGITVGIRTVDGLQRAFRIARAANRLPLPFVVVQRHVPGQDTRVTVLDGKDVFATMRLPAWVDGDGEHSIGELIARWNEALPIANRRIKLGEHLIQILAAQRMSLDSVPNKGKRVLVNDVSNARQGGICVDVTDVLCAEARAIACALARELKMGVLGVDFISPDIRTRAGLIIELNSAPALNLHEVPTVGHARDVAGPLLDLLFPEG